MIRMCNNTTTKASLFQPVVLGSFAKKNASKRIGNYGFSSLNISGLRKCKFSDDLYIYPIIEIKSWLNLHVLKFDCFVLDF